MSSVIGHTKGSPPRPRSAPVYTPITPGMAFAADVSIESTVACTYGGRTIAIHAMPAIVMLSRKFACPVSRSGSSLLRRTGCPMNVSVVAMSAPLCSRAAHGAGGVEDRLHDVLVAGAAAEVALEGLAYVLLGRRGVLLQEARRRHDHAGRAVAALE